MSQPDKESEGPGGVRLASVAAVLLLALGVGVPQMFMQSTRPQPSHVPREHYPNMQQVPARLWEDPFEAISHGAAGPSASTPAKKHSDEGAETSKAKTSTDIKEIRKAIAE